MVENVAYDDVESKPPKIEASDVTFGDVKPNVDVKFKVKIPFKLILFTTKKNLNRYLPITLKKNLNLNLYIPVFVVLK